MFLWQAGGKLVEKKGDKWRVALNSPAGVRALQFYISMKPVSEPEVATSSAVETGNAFVAKRVAMHYLGPWAIADAWQKAPDADVYAAPLPKDVNRATVYSTENLVMFRNNKHPAESLKLMRFLAGPDAAKLLMVGEGGKYPFRVPVIKSMESDPFFQKDHPEFKAFLQGFSYGEKIFPIKGWTRVHNEAMQLHLNKAVNGQETPENALAAIEREGNKILDEIYKY
jgi:multiple sugar transport system substrate-binding protein